MKTLCTTVAPHQVFAMKRNNRSDQDKIDSIRSECAVLARLGCHHDNVVRFLGAVIDEDLEQHPPRICKMMMELAESEWGRERELAESEWGGERELAESEWGRERELAEREWGRERELAESEWGS